MATLVSGLPVGLNAAVFIVQHIDPRSTGELAAILGRAGPLPSAMAVDGEAIAFGEIRVARPDHHLILEKDCIRVVQGPKENRSRPAIDPLFRSAAHIYRSRVTGVVLTGYLDDGTAGLWAIKRAGGIAVVQDPADAEHPDMPKNALNGVQVDHCVPIKDMARLMVDLTNTPAGETPPKVEQEFEEVPGIVYVCPDCGGPLREIKIGNEKLVRFRCLVGHAYSMITLLEAHAEARESVLWSAAVALTHEALLAERASEHAMTQNEQRSATSLRLEAEKARQQAQTIRDMLTSSPARGAASA